MKLFYEWKNMLIAFHLLLKTLMFVMMVLSRFEMSSLMHTLIQKEGGGVDARA